MPIKETKNDLNFKLLINTRKQLILAIIMIWGVVGLIFFAIKPQVETIFSTNQKLDQEKDQYQRITRKLEELKQIEVSDQFQQKEQVDHVLPSYKPVLELLFNLNQAVQLSGVNATNLQISPGEIATPSAELELLESGTSRKSDAPSTSKQRRYSNLALNLTVQGDSDAVDEFLELAERITPFTSIIELSIRGARGGDEEKSTSSTEAEMTLHSYYYTQVITTDIDDSLPTVSDEELRAFNTIQQFVPSGFQQPTEVRNFNVEDLFEVPGFQFEGISNLL
ncbi:MAG: hypothetical protein XD95_0654 [Microgenomates bacterium 39_7]|nr:MAG: hypothetical protein XD95_0654 [Microgenomates bacterium 39_7]